jgi:hypothetical protein
MGRIAMAMELMTVAMIIEDHSILPTKEDTISVLQTLIVDQALVEDSSEWYHRLCDWRRIKLYDAAADVSSRGVAASDHEGLLGAEPPRELPGAQHGSDQTTDPPSSE